MQEGILMGTIKLPRNIINLMKESEKGMPRHKNPPIPPPKKENKSISSVKSFIQASPLKAWNSLALTICSAIIIYITYSNKEMTVEELVLAFWPFYLLYVLLCIVMAKVSE